MLPELNGIPLPDSREAYDLVTAHNEKYDEAYILEKAATDALHNIPSVDSDDLTSFEKQLLHETSLLANKVALQYKKSLELIDAVIKAEESAFTTIKTYQESDLAEHNNNFVEDVQNSYQPKEISRRLTQAEARYNEFYEKYRRPPTVYIPHWLYIILALIIFVGEIPLNALVFQIFGENQIMTWIMATIIGLSVPLIAHFVGIKFREHPDKVDYANLIKGLIALSVVVAALYGLSVMRQTYLGENKDALGLTDNLVASSFMFFWLNIAVLGAAVMISYMSHDSVPGYQNAELELKRARKNAANLDHVNQKKKTSSRYQKLDMIKGSKVDTIDTEKKIIMLKGYYDMLLKEGQELERQCMQGFQHDVELYRRENLQKRPDKTKPKIFSEKPTFELLLTKMNEKLVN
jgi:hypothetical protein